MESMSNSTFAPCTAPSQIQGICHCEHWSREELEEVKDFIIDDLMFNFTGHMQNCPKYQSIS